MAPKVRMVVGVDAEPVILLYSAPASTVGITVAAWLYMVPYQGTRNLSSLASVTPRKATMAPAVGPPKAVAARIGAIATLTTDPRGVRTGNEDAARVRIVQKARPGTPAPRASIAELIGQRTTDAPKRKMAATMTAITRIRSDLVT
jgi:hypothetical protein